MISDHVLKFVGAIGPFFPPPRGSDEEQATWLAAMDRKLRGMEPEVLAAAADEIIETRDPKKDGRFFPLPAECISACDKARARLTSIDGKPLLSHGQSDPSPWATWRCELANDLIKTEMGRKAARERWIISLWNYCREHGKLPSEIEAAKIVKGVGDIADFVESLARSDDSHSRRCAEFGRTVLARQAVLCQYVLEGGVRPKWD